MRSILFFWRSNVGFFALKCRTNALKRRAGSVAYLIAAILYQGNPDRNHKLWNIVSTVRYILHIIYRCCWNVATYERKVYNGKIEIISFVVKFRS
jgi:hypothetical protein